MNSLFGATVEVQNSEYDTSSYIVRTQIIIWTPYFNPVTNKLITPYFNPVTNKLWKPLFEETVKVHNSECDTSLKGTWQNKSHIKCLTIWWLLNINTPCICIGMQYMVIQTITHRTKIWIIPWLNIAPYGHKCMQHSVYMQIYRQ